MSMDIEGLPLSNVVFHGKYIIMDNNEDEPEICGTVEQGNGARVDKAKRQQSFMEKLIGVRNAQCEMYLTTMQRVLDKHATHNMRAIHATTNQLKYDYKCMQVSQQQNELAARQRADPDIDLEYEQFLIQQTQKYLIYNPNNCCYTDKSLRYPPRSGIHSGGGPISPTLSKARKILQDTTVSKAPSHDSRNVRFHLTNDTNGTTDYDTNPGPESTVTMPSLCSSSNADADISPDPDKLFVPPERAPTVQEATMEHFKRRLHMRHSLETLKMAPYKVLLDENKAARSYPDPVVVKNGDFERAKTWLPAIHRAKTSLTPKALQNGDALPEPPSKFHSRSDTFLAKSRGTSAATGHRLRTPNLSAKARKTTFSSGTTTPGKPHNDQQSLASRNSAKSGLSRPATTKSTAPTIKTRPVTHAMLKREKTELSDKLGSFLNKLDEEKRQNARQAKGLHTVENSTPMHSAHGRHPNHLKTKAFPPALTSNQTNTSKSKPQAKSKPSLNPSNPRITLNDKPLTITNSLTAPSTTTTTSSPRTSSSSEQSAGVRGIPVYTARRSQRHTATEKLRRVVAALVAGRSKAETMHLDNIRMGQGDKGDKGEEPEADVKGISAS